MSTTGLWVVGYRENLFHYLPQVNFFATWEEAKLAIAAWNHRVEEKQP